MFANTNSNPQTKRNEMTAAQLEKMGILTERTKLNPNRYWCNTTQGYLTIHKTDTMETVLQMIFDSGMQQGLEVVKNKPQTK